MSEDKFDTTSSEKIGATDRRLSDFAKGCHIFCGSSDRCVISRDTFDVLCVSHCPKGDERELMA